MNFFLEEFKLFVGFIKKCSGGLPSTWHPFLTYRIVMSPRLEIPGIPGTFPGLESREFCLETFETPPPTSPLKIGFNPHKQYAIRSPIWVNFHITCSTLWCNARLSQLYYTTPWPSDLVHWKCSPPPPTNDNVSYAGAQMNMLQYACDIKNIVM